MGTFERTPLLPVLPLFIYLFLEFCGQFYCAIVMYDDLLARRVKSEAEGRRGLEEN